MADLGASLQPRHLTQRGIERIDDPKRIILCCKTCGQRWSPDFLPGGRLLDRFWQCPNNCNELLWRLQEGKSYTLPGRPGAYRPLKVEASFNTHTDMELHVIGSHPGRYSYGFFVVSVERGELLYCPYQGQIEGVYPGLASTRIMIRDLKRIDQGGVYCPLHPARVRRDGYQDSSADEMVRRGSFSPGDRSYVHCMDEAKESERFSGA